MAVAKLKKCKECGSGFVPTRFAQVVCSPICGINHSRKLNEKKIAKAWKEEKKVLKDKIKTHSDWLKDLQKVFNEFIRLRDKELPCISCGKEISGVGHASHFYSVGSTPNLRFNEDNVHLSCIECNLYKHGFLIGYSLKLPDKIGKERFEKLIEDSKKTILKKTIPEIKDMIVKYKLLNKKLKDDE